MPKETKGGDKFTAVNELARRRGFFWQSYEIYGGVGGFYTYGSLGARLKQNIERKLRELFVNKLGLLEIESPIIAPSKVFEASGHVEHFKEPMVECKKCGKRFRADQLLHELGGVSGSEAEKLNLDQLAEAIRKSEVKCPECGGEFGDPKYFLTMFQTTIGPYSDAVGYGRPEAAQGIFVEFKRLCEMARGKLPFGVLQIGRSLRNEISPRQGLVRLREFTIADLEFFFDPENPECHFLEEVKDDTLTLLLADARLKSGGDHDEDSAETVELTVREALETKAIKAEWQAVFMALAKRLLLDLGVPAEKQRFIEKLPWERAHYSLQSFDQEVWVERWGWVEVSGHAYRTDYDLKSHMQASGEDMTMFREHEKPVETEKYIVKPVMAKMGPVFKTDAAKIAETLLKAKPEEVVESLRKNKYYLVGKHKVLPEHIDVSRQKVTEQGRRFIPHVVEPSFGSDRLVYVALEHAYCIKEDRAVLGFPRDIAPTQIGVYPLMSKDGLLEKAFELHKMLVTQGFLAEFDEAGSIGRRYARADEAGTPLGITVDYDTLNNGTVTLRDRDSWKQVRTRIEDLPELLRKYFRWEIDFPDMGEPVDS